MSTSNGGGLGRVLIIVENLPVPFDRRVWQEATALREAGYVVSVICPKGKGYDKTEETLNGIHIYRHGLPLEAKGGALGYLVEYGAALTMELFLSFRVRGRHGFDAIHACNPPDLIFLVALVHKILFRTRFLFDQHDISPELFEVKFGRKGLFHRLLTFFEWCTYQIADVCIATSENLKMLATSRGGVSSDDVFVVRSFPDLSRFVRKPPNNDAKGNHRFLVGYVGIMAEQDGVETLVRAMDNIVHALGRRDVGCIIVGDGPDYDRLRGLAEQLKLTEHVHFTGYLTGDELLSTLSACDIGVIPDPPNVCNTKLSMNKVFEYMALGLPFVQFDLTQAREDADEAALVVGNTTPEALAGGMVTLLDDAERRARVSVYASERAQREFDWNAEKRTLLAAYRALLPDYAVRLLAESAEPSQE